MTPMWRTPRPVPLGTTQKWRLLLYTRYLKSWKRPVDTNSLLQAVTVSLVRVMLLMCDQPINRSKLVTNQSSCQASSFLAAMVDSVEEGLQASRRFLLLYNASTFRHTSNNNNIILSEDNIISTDSKTGNSFVYDDGGVYPDHRQQFEIVGGMHRALLEGSLKVRKSTSS